MTIMHAAMEAISYQGDDFGIKLTALFEALMSKNYSEAQANQSAEMAAIRKATADRFKLNLIVQVKDISAGASNMFPIVDMQSPYIEDLIRKILSGRSSKLIEDAKELKGSIDLDRAQVSGLFSKLQCTITLPWRAIRFLKLTPAEMAAIFCHEIGHSFVEFEFAGTAIRTNQVLLAALKSVETSGGGREHKMVLRKASEVLTDYDDQLDELENVTDKKTISTVILGLGFRSYKSEFGKNASNYDKSSVEAMCDTFATRFGLGRELVTGLEKYAVEFNEPGKNGFFARLSVLAYDISALLLAPLSVMIFPFMPIMGALGLFISFIHITYEGDANRDYTYDELYVRYTRVREQMVGYLKDRTLPAEVVKRHLQNIKIVDKFIADARPEGSLGRALANFVLPWHREAKTAIQLQRDLEALAANDLFAQAAALRSL